MLGLKNKFCDLLENSEKFDKKYAYVNSGTAALQCALFSIKLKKGDEIIILNFGWSSDLMAIISLVQLIRILRKSIRFSKVKNQINKKTKAIINIHMRGHPNDHNKIKNTSKIKNLFN